MQLESGLCPSEGQLTTLRERVKKGETNEVTVQPLSRGLFRFTLKQAGQLKIHASTSYAAR